MPFQVEIRSNHSVGNLGGNIGMPIRVAIRSVCDKVLDNVCTVLRCRTTDEKHGGPAAVDHQSRFGILRQHQARQQAGIFADPAGAWECAAGVF